MMTSIQKRYVPIDWEEAAKNIKGRFISVGDCLLWNGSTVHGYGSVSIHNKSYRVHRILWQLLNGAIPSAATHVDVLHKCGNKLCSNPAHLYLGTAQDNLRDFYRSNSMPDGRRAFSKKEKDIILTMLNEHSNSLRKIARAVGSDHHKIKRFIESMQQLKKEEDD